MQVSTASVGGSELRTAHNFGESDTSGWDCVHMSVVERFEYAASLQVLYEDMKTYKDDIKTYKDWMFALKRLETMQSLNPSLFEKCITECWIPIGKSLVKTMQDEEVYIVLEKLAVCQKNIFEMQYSQSRHIVSPKNPLSIKARYQKERILQDDCMENSQTKSQIYESFHGDLLEKLGIDDFLSWSNVFDRLSNNNQIDQKFLKQLVLKHFLPKAEKFIDEAYISSIHQLLLKVSGLKLAMHEADVTSFVRRICRQRVLRYLPKKNFNVEMYIDMLSILGDMMQDESLKDPQRRQVHSHNRGLDNDTLNDIVPFFKICFSVFSLNVQQITSLEQTSKIQRIRRKFSSVYVPSEVQQWDVQMSKIIQTQRKTVDKEEIQRKVIKIISKVLAKEEETVYLQSGFAALGANSQKVNEIMMILDEEFMLALDDKSTPKQIQSVQGVVDFIVERMKAQ